MEYIPTLTYDAKISQYGNSYIIYLPKGSCKHEGLEIGDIVRIKLTKLESKPSFKSFTISGNNVSLTKEKILNICNRDKIPSLYYGNKNVKYCIMVNNERYPIKWVLSEATGLNPVLFTTDYAKRILNKFGFEIRDDWNE